MNSYLRAITVLLVFMVAVSVFIFLGIFLKNLVSDGGTQTYESDTVLDATDGADVQPQPFALAGEGDSLSAIENGDAEAESSAISQIYNNYNGVYLDIQKLNTIDDLQNFITDIKEKSVNAVNIDIKYENGFIPFSMENQMAMLVGAVNPNPNDELNITTIINMLHENNIYVSGTIVCFKDDLASTTYPNYSLLNKSDLIRWSDADGNHWLNVYSEGARDYIRGIVQECVKLGFDEIILSYFFFPNLSNPNDLEYSNSDGTSKYDAVESFIGDIDAAVKQISPETKLGINIPLRYFLTSPHETTGINPASLIESNVCDFIMTSFAPSEIPTSVSINGSVISNAAQNPYDSLKSLCTYFEDYIPRIMFRPVLQAYDSPDGVKYGNENIMAQKQALYEADIKVWQLLNFDNSY